MARSISKFSLHDQNLEV